MTTGGTRQNPIPPKESGNTNKKIKPKRVKQAKKATRTQQHPGSPLQVDHTAYMDEKAGTTERFVIHDKWWLAAFLVHTLGYLGTSAFINYAAITNDKLPIKEGTLGPIDTYVLH